VRETCFGALKIGDRFKDSPAYFIYCEKISATMSVQVHTNGKRVRGTREAVVWDAVVYVDETA
jgi:hypothetical protein